MDRETQARWNARYLEIDRIPMPAAVLLENTHLLPAQGVALELACGLGANSLWLAEHGLQTYAWDISSVAIEKLNAIAKKKGLPLIAEVRDAMCASLPPDGFDVIVVTHYLERSLNEAIIRALKVNGLLYFQTFTRTAVSTEGPQCEEWRLLDGELLAMFAPLQPLVYREEGRVGDVTQGFRNKALLVSMKTALS